MRNLPRLLAIIFAVVSALGCDNNPRRAVKGQTNATVTFYAKALDQEGNPLTGARFEYRLESYPKDWTFDTRGRPKDASNVTLSSGSDGRFERSITGCELILIKAECPGYRHLFDEDLHSDGVLNRFITLISWSDLCYKTDPEHPAIYVFVKDGVSEVTALPSRGGYDSGNGTHWTLNQPGWPHKPSLKDVVQKQPVPGPNRLSSKSPGGT